MEQFITDSCDARQRSCAVKIVDRIKTLEHVVMGDDHVPRFGPILTFEKRCDNFTAAIRDLEKKIEAKDERVEKMFSEILTHVRS